MVLCYYIMILLTKLSIVASISFVVAAIPTPSHSASSHLGTFNESTSRCPHSCSDKLSSFVPTSAVWPHGFSQKRAIKKMVFTSTERDARYSAKYTSSINRHFEKLTPEVADGYCCEIRLDSDTHRQQIESVRSNCQLQSNARRLFILSSLGTSSGIFSLPSSAKAAKGAAEYDLEYYLRDIVMGNKPEGNLPASNAPTPPPPRVLNGPLLPLLLDDNLESCIAIQELARITQQSVSTLSEQIQAVRSKVKPAFEKRYPWKEESVSDEYYFDLTSYSLWKTASISPALAENYVKRDEFARSIGRQLLKEIISKELISKTSIEEISNSRSDPKLTKTIPCIIEVLNLFQQTNYCTSYRLGDKNDEDRTGLRVFDELDDEEISTVSGGGNVNCLVSIFNPAVLGAALQITGEGSRFAPDFVGPTLAAVWERLGGENSGLVSVSYESYFVDPVYRPNPKDFFPDERLYQFTITRKS